MKVPREYNSEIRHSRSTVSNAILELVTMVSTWQPSIKLSIIKEVKVKILVMVDFPGYQQSIETKALLPYGVTASVCHQSYVIIGQKCATYLITRIK